MGPSPPRLEIFPGIWLDGRLALWLAAPRVLVVADLHWGYAASHRAQGNLLPMWGDDEIARRLASLIADYQPAEMIWLGDSLHTLAGRTAAEVFLGQTATPVIVLSGNHDRKWTVATRRTLEREGYFFHHGDLATEVPTGCVEIIGHHHPALSWSDGAGTRLKLPALIASSRRLIVPAFSPWAAGTAWNEAVIPGETLFAIAPRRIFAVPSTSKAPVA